MLDLETQLQGPEFRVLSPRSWVPVQKIVEVITECEENLLKVVTAITKCDRKVLQSMEGITRWCSKLLQSVKITEQKMKFSIKDFFSKCDQIRSSKGIWSHLLEKSFMEDSIFCAVNLAIKKRDLTRFSINCSDYSCYFHLDHFKRHYCVSFFSKSKFK